MPFVRTQAGGKDVYWKSNDLRDHRALGYEYPETAAARRQTQEPFVQALRRWANSELGWLGRITSQGDPAAIARLNDSLTRSIPFFPKEVLIDGDKNRPIRSNQAFVGSKFVATATPAPKPAAPTPRGFASPPIESQFSALAVSPPSTMPPVEPSSGQQHVPTPQASAPVTATAEPATAQRSVEPEFAPPPKGKHSRSLSGLTSKLAAKVASVADRKDAAPSTSPSAAATSKPPTKDRTHGISSLASKLATKAVSVASQKIKEATSSKPQAAGGSTPEQQQQQHSHGITAIASKVHQVVHDAVEELHGDVHAAVKDAHETLHDRVLRRAIPFVDLSFQTRFGHLANLITDDRIIQWNVTYTVDKFCLDGSFVINFFLGDFASNAGEWVLDEHLAGQSAVFASDRARIDGEGGCENCAQQEQEGLVYGDTVGLTEALLVYYGNQEEAHGRKVPSLRPEVVIPFLTRNLHWRIESVSLLLLVGCLLRGWC